MPEINIQQSTPTIDIDTATRNYHLPIASATTLGGIKVGNNLTIEEDGTLNAESTEYNLPVATSSTLGGIKIGTGLSITDGVASVNIDNNLDDESGSPLANSVITSNFSTLTTSVQSLGSTVTNIGNNLSTLTTSVSTNTGNISDLQSTVSGHTTAIATNADNIENNTSAIDDVNGSVSLLDNRLSSAEGNITTLTDSMDNLLPLAASSVSEVLYSSLLPATTWTSGSILVVKRGKVGFIYFDLEGSLTLAASTSVVLYNFEDLAPSVKATAALVTDAGMILGEMDDYSYNLSISNLSSASMTITKVKGSIPLVFE